MITEISYVLALSACIAIALLIMAVKSFRSDTEKLENERHNRLIDRKSTYFLDIRDIDEKCDICFGELESEQIYVCSCGKTFHISCSELTGECPYCNKSRNEMTIRDARKPKCPKCGKTIEDNICECGTVLPNRDGTFKCRCGADLCVNDNVCPSCGTTFISRFEQTN